MTYLDTNVLLYATLTSVDTQSQQDRAIEILKNLIDDNTLVLLIYIMLFFQNITIVEN